MQLDVKLTWFAYCNLTVKLCVKSFRHYDLTIYYLDRYWSNLNAAAPEDWVDVVYHFEKMWLSLELCEYAEKNNKSILNRFTNRNSKVNNIVSV